MPSPNSTRAFELRNEFWADEMEDIADDGSNDWMELELANGQTIEVVNQKAFSAPSCASRPGSG